MADATAGAGTRAGRSGGHPRCGWPSFHWRITALAQVSGEAALLQVVRYLAPRRRADGPAALTSSHVGWAIRRSRLPGLRPRSAAGWSTYQGLDRRLFPRWTLGTTAP